MQSAFVVGTAVATIKHRSMEGHKLLIVQPQMADRHTPDGDPQIAVDGTGVGIGQRVIITSDGRSARDIVQDENSPVRWAVIGISDV